mmetsp:Transcript_42132/g.92081  ORF Transcript_42132/g.92081 Transcript_42132/m.92081 type:complete len:200 (-) Transcript_42132:296-895(-)
MRARWRSLKSCLCSLWRASMRAERSSFFAIIPTNAAFNVAMSSSVVRPPATEASLTARPAMSEAMGGLLMSLRQHLDGGSCRRGLCCNGQPKRAPPGSGAAPNVQSPPRSPRCNTNNLKEAHCSASGLRYQACRPGVRGPPARSMRCVKGSGSQGSKACSSRKSGPYARVCQLPKSRAASATSVKSTEVVRSCKPGQAK